MLEILGIPYTGANPQGLAYCYDKSLVRGIAREMGIPVADAVFIKPEDNVFEMNIDFPVIAKPNYGDSSIAITAENVCYDYEALNDAIIRIREKVGYEKPIIVEEFLPGKEITIGIIGNPPESYTFLPFAEEDYSTLPADLPKICGYEAKWIEDSPYFKLLRSIPVNLPEETEKMITEQCLKLFERLDCRDYARFDWRFDQEGVPKLLEVNPNPGLVLGWSPGQNGHPERHGLCRNAPLYSANCRTTIWQQWKWEWQWKWKRKWQRKRSELNELDSGS